MMRYDYLIVGGGMTADAAVKGIRQIDRRGSIGVLTAEPDPPYRRPPLSKDLWTNDTSLDEIWCSTEANGAEVRRGVQAAALDPDARAVTDDQGLTYRYQRLLLATGGMPRRLPFEAEGVLYYRTRADYDRLRTWTREGERFAVLGGGFIGSEIAAALASNGKRVTMVFPEASVAGRLLPPALGRRLSRYYEERGVTVVAGRKPSALAEERGVIGVHLENGHALPSDGVVAGLGIIPNTQLARAAGLDVDDGIVVDEQLHASRPDIYAAGDVANFFNPLLDRRLRVEHEDNALSMGETAGRNMAGDTRPYHHLPFFYSDLFDLGYEAVGETDSALETFSRLDDITGQGVIYYLDRGRVRGVVFWNLFGKVDAGRELIASPGPHTAEGLTSWERERLRGDGR